MSLTGLAFNNSFAGTKFFHPGLSSVGVLEAINLSGAAYETTEGGLSTFDLGAWKPITASLTAVEYGLDSTLLVAELGASFLCATLDINTYPRPDHASYIASWLQVLKEHKTAIFAAAGAASKASLFLEALVETNRS